MPNEAWQVLPKEARWSHVISYSPLHDQIDDLLGPMTAMNGVLMFGWSTAVIFEVLRRVVRSGVEAGNDGSGANE